MKKRYSLHVMAPLLSGLLLAPVLMAQEGDSGANNNQGEQLDEMPSEQAGSKDFEQETLEQFADAYVAVGDVHSEYSERLQETEGTDDAQSVQQEANDRMVEAIEEQGLEVQQYSEIAAALERDPDLRERVVGMIEERE